MLEDRIIGTIPDLIRLYNTEEVDAMKKKTIIIVAVCLLVIV